MPGYRVPRLPGYQQSTRHILWCVSPWPEEHKLVWASRSFRLRPLVSSSSNWHTGKRINSPAPSMICVPGKSQSSPEIPPPAPNAINSSRKLVKNCQPSTPEESALCVQIVPNGSIIACSTIGAWWTIGSSFMRLPMEPRRGHPIVGFREWRDRCRRQRSWRRPPTSRS